VQNSFSAALGLNPFSAEAELVGREIRNQLERAGIRERRCVVALPASAALCLLSEVPSIPEEDVPSFLEVEAERHFPYGRDALCISVVRFRNAAGTQYAAQLAVPRETVLTVERVLRAAQLKPLSISIGLPALAAPKEAKDGVMALRVGDASVEMQLACAGGLVALRQLDEVFQDEGVRPELSTDLLLREVKITLGQLPDAFRDVFREFQIFGASEMARQLAESLRPRLASLGMSVGWVQHYSTDAFPKRLPAGTPVTAATSLAARFLTGTGTGFEFLPPKVKTWQRMTTRISSRKVAWATAAAVIVLLTTLGLWSYQKFRLSRLQAQWTAMEPKVRDLESVQGQIKRFRPWFDESFRSLTIVRRLTEAFPEDGAVTAKALEIRDLSFVTCSGVARDNRAFLRMLDQLRAAKEVRDLKVDQVRGKTPLQFTFNFQWGEKNEN
jgi:hypothetical protein